MIMISGAARGSSAQTIATYSYLSTAGRPSPRPLLAPAQPLWLAPPLQAARISARPAADSRRRPARPRLRQRPRPLAAAGRALIFANGSRTATRSSRPTGGHRVAAIWIISPRPSATTCFRCSGSKSRRVFQVQCERADWRPRGSQMEMGEQKRERDCVWVV